LNKGDSPIRYRAFVLRCWQVLGQCPGMAGTWRFSLQDVRSGQEHGFADCAELLAYLRVEFGVSAE
jgi:hypothetical protein